jgi:hypothetical protein
MSTKKTENTSNTKIVNVFVSQPMNGRTKSDFLFERHEILKEFTDFICNNLGYDINLIVVTDCNLLFTESAPDEAGRLWYLGRSIQSMEEADYVIFSRSWRDAKGCRVEYTCAREYFKYNCYPDDLKYIDRICFGRCY